MSKSLGNAIAPQNIINSKGADILRLWVASTDYTSEMRISDEILKRNSDTTDESGIPLGFYSVILVTLIQIKI